jgi:hypothetical protein
MTGLVKVNGYPMLPESTLKASAYELIREAIPERKIDCPQVMLGRVPLSTWCARADMVEGQMPTPDGGWMMTLAMVEGGLEPGLFAAVTAAALWDAGADEVVFCSDGWVPEVSDPKTAAKMNDAKVSDRLDAWTMLYVARSGAAEKAMITYRNAEIMQERDFCAGSRIEDRIVGMIMQSLVDAGGAGAPAVN